MEMVFYLLSRVRFFRFLKNKIKNQKLASLHFGKRSVTQGKQIREMDGRGEEPLNWIV